jgi:hypothetical protein
MLHLLSQASVFIYSSCGKWAFPASCGVFLPPPLLHAFPLLVAGWCRLYCLLQQLVYLQFCERFPLPPFWCSGLPALFATLLIIQFFLFSLVGDQSVWGAMLVWPWIVCGSTTCCLAHLVVCVFPSGVGTGIWWHGSSPGFSI